MYKFGIICLLHIIILQDATGSAPQKLFKRQTLIENKKNIGEGVENWAIVGDVPTPTLGRVRPSNEPERYRQHIQQGGERRNDGIRLNKRWIRDGNIDRFGTRFGVHGERHWEERKNYKNRDSRSSEEDRSRTRTYGTRDGEGRRYRRATTKPLQDDALSPIKLHKTDELATEFDAHHNNRKYDYYGDGYRRGYDRYGRYGGRRYPEDGYERSEEKIIITRHEVSAEEPYY